MSNWFLLLCSHGVKVVFSHQCNNLWHAERAYTTTLFCRPELLPGGAMEYKENKVRLFCFVTYSFDVFCILRCEHMIKHLTQAITPVMVSAHRLKVRSNALPTSYFIVFNTAPHNSVELCRHHYHLSITIQVYFVGAVQENVLVIQQASVLCLLHTVHCRWAGGKGNCRIRKWSTMMWKLVCGRTHQVSSWKSAYYNLFYIYFIFILLHSNTQSHCQGRGNLSATLCSPHMQKKAFGIPFYNIVFFLWNAIMVRITHFLGSSRIASAGCWQCLMRSNHLMMILQWEGNHTDFGLAYNSWYKTRNWGRGLNDLWIRLPPTSAGANSISIFFFSSNCLSVSFVII